MMKQIKNRVRQLGVTLTLLALLVTQTLAAVPAYLIPGGNTVGIKLYTRGLVVTAVSDGMAAQAAGLKAGDLIYYIDDVKVTDSSVLLKEIQSHEIGDTVEFTIVRDNDMKKIKVKLQAAQQAAGKEG